MSKECLMYGNQCEDCPIKEICFYLFDLPFGRTDTNAYLKIYQQGRADALGEYATILMNVFSNSCDFYETTDGRNIEAIEEEYIDDVILKCLEMVKEQK